MNWTRNVGDRPAPGAPCPRCGVDMVRIDHEIGGTVRAMPCGCAVRYRIRRGMVHVVDLGKDKAA